MNKQWHLAFPLLAQTARSSRARSNRIADKQWRHTLKETQLPAVPDAKSPAGADIRFIMDGTTGNMIHGTVPPGQINRATVHSTVSEFWYVLEGNGQIWRKDGTEERVTSLVPGVSIDIPVGTAFQYRNIGSQPLKFICITMPPWPGDHEAAPQDGAWVPTV